MTRPALVTIPRDAQQVVPWRNGGGTTRVVAVQTEGARGGFRWRVSIAQVDRDGPFSAYPGVDRLLWLLRGAGMRLVVDGREVRVDRLLVPFALRGEAVVESFLIAGPTEDLNVMVERATTRADARVVTLARAAPLELGPRPGEETLVLALDAEVALHGAGEGVRVLRARDALLLANDTAQAWRVHTDARATVLLAGFARIAAG